MIERNVELEAKNTVQLIGETELERERRVKTSPDSLKKAYAYCQMFLLYIYRGKLFLEINTAKFFGFTRPSININGNFYINVTREEVDAIYYRTENPKYVPSKPIPLYDIKKLDVEVEYKNIDDNKNYHDKFFSSEENSLSEIEDYIDAMKNRKL